MSGVAIIGIGCRFPGGASDPETYWTLLCEGRSVISEIPDDRWSLEGFFDPEPDKPNRSYSRWGGFLDDVGDFDPDFFGLSIRETEAMDPQQRLLLMTGVEAIQDAGLRQSDLRQAETGVFVGASNIDYNLLARQRTGHGDIQAGTGTAFSILANRVSHQLDLKGPSLTVDTACSSSMVALDIACEKLLSGACDSALAGGVNILLDPRMFITFSRARMLSRRGEIRAFDAQADGFVRGEGAAVVVLKRENDALRDGNRIYAVIRATAVNQDGATSTITAPNEEAQSRLFRKAAALAGITPSDVSFVEAHGTGTALGDPVEAHSAGQVMGGANRKEPLLIGSVKSTIGHLEPAAGIAGLIKAALSLHKGAVPPSARFETPNPAIPFDELNIQVPQAVMPLANRGANRYALVNSSGFGGTNACAILQAASQRAPEPDTAGAERAGLCSSPDVPVPVPLSGPTQAHLRSWAATLSDALQSGCRLADVSLPALASALSQQQDPSTFRAVIVARTIDELVEGLDGLASGTWSKEKGQPDYPQIFEGGSRGEPRIAFTFTGQGGQWWAMGRSLIEQNPLVRGVIEEFDACFEQQAGWSVLHTLLADEQSTSIHDASITPAVMFALQAALAALWRHVGVHPELVIGHSFGEVTAAHTAGSLATEDVAHLVKFRGLIRHAVDRKGTMAAIGLGADDIEPLLPADGSIEIGAYNSASLITLSGEEGAIDDLIDDLQKRDPNLLARKLDLDFAWHSSWLDPAKEEFEDQVGRLAWKAPRLPVISTVTGTPRTRFDTRYWWQNLRQPVRFDKAVHLALDQGVDTFVEIGPLRTLSVPTAECAAETGKDVTTVTTLQRKTDAHESFMQAVAQLYANGVDIDWENVLGHADTRVRLPLYPWQLQHVWSQPDEATQVHFPKDQHPWLGTRRDGLDPVWINDISLETQPLLAEHRIGGKVVFPLACVIEMMRACACVHLDAEVIELNDLKLHEALYLDAECECLFRTRFDPERSRIQIHTRHRGSENWTLYAESYAYTRSRFPNLSFSAPPSGELAPGEFYSTVQDLGYGYGTGFRGLAMIRTSAGKAYGEIALPMEYDAGDQNRPCLLDACLQLILALQGDSPALFMPRAISRILISGRLGSHAVATASRTPDQRSDTLGANVSIIEPNGQASMRVEGLSAAVVAREPTMRVDREDSPGEFYLETLNALEARAEESAISAANGKTIVFGEPSCPTCSELLRSLESEGHETLFVGRTMPEKGDKDFGQAHSDALAHFDSPDTQVIYSVALQPATLRDLTDVAELACVWTQDLLAFVQQLHALDPAFKPQSLLVLISGTDPDSAAENGLGARVIHGALAGCLRTTSLEVPEIEFRLARRDGAAFDARGRTTTPAHVYAGEPELTVQGGEILVPRLSRRTSEQLEPRKLKRHQLAGEQEFALRQTGGAGADSLAWQMLPGRPPEPGKIRIEVRAAGLNFRDVMAVAGALPPEAEPGNATEALGLEFAGVVTNAPAGGSFTKGARVFGIARGSLSRFIDLGEDRLHRIPDDLSDAEAASIPSVFLTVWYGLVELARLQPGETVLIHNASGGVGLAAVMLARHLGAKICATAGSEDKRSHLRELGIPVVENSRSLDFADAVLEATDGRGVDVVLNALNGSFIEKSLQCLAPYGRFVELGKRDIYADRSIGLKALRRNISFHVVDLAALVEDRPDVVSNMMQKILAAFQSGEMQPLPLTEIPAGRIVDAFTAFSAPGHIGKVVVDMMDADTQVRVDPSHSQALSDQGTYLVTGGTRGFGLRVGLWLAENGAGRVVLASRSGSIASEHLTVLEDAQRNGHRIDVIPLDVANEQAVYDAISALIADDLPLRGIVHAAAAYADATLSQMSPEDISASLAPKLVGAANITKALLDQDAQLDFVVNFSSVARLTGWPGQANYTAANNALVEFTHLQRSLGLPASSIDWGPLEDSGQVARDPRLLEYLESSGWIATKDSEALQALSEVLARAPGSYSYVGADWNQLLRTHPVLSRSARFAHLAKAGGQFRPTDPSDLMAISDEKIRATHIEGYVRQEIGRILRSDPANADAYETLEDAGLDSLSSLVLRARLETAFGISIPTSRYATVSTIPALAGLVCALTGETDGSPQQIGSDSGDERTPDARPENQRASH